MIYKLLIASLLIHASILSYKTSKEIKKKPKPKVSRHQEINVKFVDTSAVGRKSCPDFYIGVGVFHSYGNRVVTEVSKGGPADRNDVRIGDIFIKKPDYTALEIGTIINVKIIRNGIIIIKNIKVDKICTNNGD